MSAYQLIDLCRRTANRAGLPALLNSIGLLDKLYWSYWRVYAHFYDKDIIARSVGDVKSDFNVNDWRELRHLHGDFEENILRYLLNNIEPNDVFFDVGAHIGIYSCLTAQIIDGGSVVSFEPNSEMRARLQSNLSPNNLSNVTVLPVALSDENTEGTITGEDVKKNNNFSSQIQLVRGENVITNRNLQQPSVVKIDVEGGELMILEGLEATLKQYCRLIYIEVYPNVLEGGQPPAVEEKLRKMGFHVSQIDDTETDVYYLKNEKSV